jgi:hypothetical protein
MTIPTITPGMTLAIPETHYCYGCGLLLLRIEPVDVDQNLLQSLEWVVLSGLELSQDTGAVVGPREVAVRTSALHEAVRRGHSVAISAEPASLKTNRSSS